MANEPQRTESEALDDVRLYLEAAAQEPLLTKQEEVELAMAIERGREAEERLRRGRMTSPRSIAEAKRAVEAGERARRRFILANLRLVVSVARKYQGQGLPLLDLVQEGNIGLMRGVELFDWRRGFKFSTYATWWIRQAITRAIADRGRQIRVPVHVHERIRKVRSTAWRIVQETGEEPSNEELARLLDTTPEEIADLLELERRQPVSIHTPVGEDSELGEFVEDEASQAAYDEVDEGLVREEVAKAMDEVLEEQERRVLALRFGLDQGSPRSLREVGGIVGLSAERVRVVEREALSKLRAADAVQRVA